MFEPPRCSATTSATIVPPLSILAAILTRSTKVLVVVLIVLVPWSAIDLHDILFDGMYGRAPHSCVHCTGSPR